jgi:TATA-binding protein-associated factor Taf7
VEAGKEPDPSLRDTDVKMEYDAQRLMPAGEKLDSAIRESKMVAGSPSKTNGFGAPGSKKTLDDWLAEEEAEEADSDEKESDEDAEETEEESSEEESEEEDEESDDDDEHDRLVK